jgi:hypothetical protein
LSVIAATLVAVTPAVAASKASARVVLATTVSWTDADGRTGSAQFQGSARGRKLTGILQAAGQEVRVRGTIERDGRIEGALETSQGQAIGTFTGRVDARGQLDGTWFVDGASGGALSAPADGLPVRGPRAPEPLRPHRAGATEAPSAE